MSSSNCHSGDSTITTTVHTKPKEKENEKEFQFVRKDRLEYLEYLERNLSKIVEHAVQAHKHA